MKYKNYLTIGIFLIFNLLSAQTPSPFIHVDQFGYPTNANKVAVLSDPQVGYNANDSYTPSALLELRNAMTNTIVFSAAPTLWNGGNTHVQSGDKGWWFDFSSFTTPGTYYVFDAANNQKSAVFDIADDMYGNVLKATGRMFYYNRCNIEKTAPYAENGWTDGTSFTNNLQDANCRFIYNPNNASLEKDLTQGWFDAGDYNKYVTFANSAVHNLLWAYQENPSVFGDDWGIPESNNNIPDILDELKWELDWLLKMNNDDGSTHIKMGSKNYAENISSPPSANTNPRYYGPTCSSASIAVAGMFAHAAKVFKDFPAMSGFVAELELSAKRSWKYVLPLLKNNQLETDCDDGSIVAGDADWTVEQQEGNAVAAAVHLFDLTNDNSYNQYIIINATDTKPINTGSWTAYELSLIDALFFYTTLAGADNITKTEILNAALSTVNNDWGGYYGFNDADLYRAHMPDWAYHVGSNFNKSGFGILNKLLEKYNINPSSAADYENKAMGQIHYLHGVNPQGLVYLTNMYSLGADKSANEMFHLWFAHETVWDNAINSLYGPPPGYVTGGANQYYTAMLSPPAGQPIQKSYLDFNEYTDNSSWEITEPSIIYQASYLRLLANYAAPVSLPSTQTLSPFIHVDQFGYTTNTSKVAVLSDPQVGYNANDSYTPSALLELRNAVNDAVVFSAPPTLWNGGNTHAQSGDKGWWFDFSNFTTPGTYYVFDAANNQKSAVFDIADDMYGNVLKATGRMFYYNRCNIEKTAPYAENGWTDGTSFTNNLQDANCRFIYNPNNASLEKDLTQGWFDAGDYNKYVTFANSAVHNLLWAYQENPSVFGDDWGIPESNNNIPDILDELKWELDWLLKMNNDDGSTHIKMGSKNYSENAASPPSVNMDPRYYGPTCSAASIAVAGMFAHAAKVFKDFPGMSGFVAELELSAKRSWKYVLPLLYNKQLEIACDDGSIVSGDADWSVEEQEENAVVAAIHLFDLTNDYSYNQYVIANANTTEPLNTGFWSAYKLALNDALLFYTTLPAADIIVKTNILNAISINASNNWNGYYGFNDADLYRAYMPSWAYHWGSNLPKAGFGVLNKLLEKYNINVGAAADYAKKAVEQIHYFHGVNPQGMVYLSNMYAMGADKSANQIYHGWFADETNWDDALNSLYGPAPGYLVGGPNHYFSVNTLNPPFGQPDQKSYLDFNSGWPNNSWEITEPSISYQAVYVRLLANYATGTSLPPTKPSDFTAKAIEYSKIEAVKRNRVSAIKLYPNPVQQKIHIQTELSNYSLQIKTVLGKTLFSKNKMQEEEQVDLSFLEAGVYFIQIKNELGQEVFVQKILKL